MKEWLTRRSLAACSCLYVVHSILLLFDVFVSDRPYFRWFFWRRRWVCHDTIRGRLLYSCPKRRMVHVGAIEVLTKGNCAGLLSCENIFIVLLDYVIFVEDIFEELTRVDSHPTILSPSSYLVIRLRRWAALFRSIRCKVILKCLIINGFLWRCRPTATRWAISTSSASNWSTRD